MKILVVDDEQVSRMKMQKVLSSLYSVIAVENGKKALELAQSMDVDIILLDIRMPGIDGYEVCRQLKQNTRTADIPVIFLTSMGQTLDVTMGFDLGAVDFITKPVSPPILRARVAAQLTLHNQKRILEEKIQERTRELIHTREEVVTMLGVAADFRDNETGLHINRVSRYCRMIASAGGLNEEFTEMIALASPLHDVGKIGIPDQILLKPGKLSVAEFEVIKTHCVIGRDILKSSTWSVLQLAQSIAMTHHEKWNGAGYPRGLRGEEIPIEGRITAIADVFDALSTKRPYKEAWPLEKCIAQINDESGNHFDPNLVQAFNTALPQILRTATELADPAMPPEPP
ncbi:response regulator [Desulfonatronum thioautotrophicum]|uniref:response regulator n=1 Tax=Desulfonatronum thioautotrophicum TaxID=617001 RepID=UPI001FC979A8|nr:two-component system response regulator [Desulfonatronum thioautotrophicum]